MPVLARAFLSDRVDLNAPPFRYLIWKGIGNTYSIAKYSLHKQRYTVLFVVVDIKNNGAFMNADNYKISTLPYIENASNEIMEKYNIKAQYETEPPHGDAIYSISIKGKALPFWIYGRDVTFIGYSMVMVESVRCKTWDPIETIIIDLENEVYASLKEWYTDISFVNNRIEFFNQVVKMDKRILNNFENLEWISF